MTGIVFAPFPSFETALARLLRMRPEPYFTNLMLRSEGLCPSVSKHVSQTGARP